MSELKRTPLYQEHVALGGKLVDFGGWALPVQFSGILTEHAAVREAAGLFDVSHMGEIMVSGVQAEEFLQHLLTNDLTRIVDGQVAYSPVCYADGGVVDDILVYRYNREKYLLVVNAANTDKDWQWLQAHAEGFAVTLENLSAAVAQIALQGPAAQRILARLCNYDLEQVKFYRFVERVEVAGVPALLSRSGYTGEDGFELYAASTDAAALWRALLAAGAPEGLLPVGLGARDTLRFEAALPLYGHELAADILPLEAGLEAFVRLDKAEFIGKEALVAAQTAGIKRRLVGLEMLGRGIAREHYPVLSDGREAGFVTSGSFAPSVGKNLALALVEAELAEPGTLLEVQIRNKAVAAQVIAKPFLTKKYKK